MSEVFPNIEVRGEPRPNDLSAGQWNADAYVSAVHSNLRRIDQARVGRILMGHIPRLLVIIPYVQHGALPNARATVGRQDWPHETPPDARVDAGTGLGAYDVHIRYTPGLFVEPDAPTVAAPGLHPYHSDSVLVHEMFHAIEAMTGRLRYATVGRSTTDIQDVAEHRAVRIGNMYRSETHRPLRGPYNDSAYLEASGYSYARRGWRRHDAGAGLIGYRGTRRVQRDPADPRHEHMVDFEVSLIGQLMLDHPSLTDALERVPEGVCPYNPIREFLRGRFDTLLLPAYWAPPGIPRSRPSWVGHTV